MHLRIRVELLECIYNDLVLVTHVDEVVPEQKNEVVLSLLKVAEKEVVHDDEHIERHLAIDRLNSHEFL